MEDWLRSPRSTYIPSRNHLVRMHVRFDYLRLGSRAASQPVTVIAKLGSAAETPSRIGLSPAEESCDTNLAKRRVPSLIATAAQMRQKKIV